MSAEQIPQITTRVQQLKEEERRGETTQNETQPNQAHQNYRAKRDAPRHPSPLAHGSHQNPETPAAHR